MPPPPSRCRARALPLLALLLLSWDALAHGGAEPPSPRVALLGIWDRAKPAMERASREAGVGLSVLDPDDVLAEGGPALVAAHDVLCILNLPVAETVPMLRALRRAKALHPKLVILPLDRRDTQIQLDKAGLLAKDPRASAYWRASGPVNMRRLLTWIAVKYLGARGELQPPASVPEHGYFHPDVEEAVADLAAYRRLAGWRAGAPVAAILIQQSFWITRDTAVIEAERRALQRRGFNAVVLFGDTGARVEQMLRELAPALVVEDRHGSIWQGGAGQPILEALDVPYLRPISMLAYTERQWREDPRGLHPRDVGHFMTLQEMKGTVDPLVVGALKQDVRGFKLHVPIQGRIERFAERAAAWQRLASKPNDEKRVAIVYYNKSLGRDDLLRGSPTGAFLDGPASLVRFLPRLAERGFAVAHLPGSVTELLARVGDSGRNIGPWAQGELERMVDRGGPVLVPEPRLRRWLNEKLTEAQRRRLGEHFGPPPGRLMVVTRNGVRHIVLPVVRLGHVVLAPQPERGENQDERLLHSRDVPPPYNYLAFYWWLQDELHADAVMHWGTHGSLELLPGKEAGLTGRDWSDLCTGALPVINPWIMDNLGESTLSRRRSYAVLVDHLVPPAVNAGLSGPLRGLHDDIARFDTLQEGMLRRAFRERITEGTRAGRIDSTLGIQGLDGRLLTDPEVQAVGDYLHELHNATTPTTLHVLGLLPGPDLLASWLVSILRAPFLERLGRVFAGPRGEREGDRSKRLRRVGEGIMREAVLSGGQAPAGIARDVAFARDMLARLRRVDDELGRLVHALEGGYVPPGPGPDPIRNPSSAPSGRNLYTLNPEEIPTRPSWEVAKKLVEELLRDKHPRKVGIDLNGMNTMRDFGVMEGQIMALIGVRPVWDANNLVVDVEVIPREELGRPRVDVFVAMGGQYKENFPTRVKLLDKAIRRVSALDEPDNGVRAGSGRQERRLLARGFSAAEARALSPARIFGGKPGNLGGTNILHLVPRSGVWTSDDEVTRVYVETMSHVFTGGRWGDKIEGLYEEAIQGTDTLLRVWASNMTSQLSNHHAYEYLGGLSMAVKKLTGRDADAFIADVRDPAGARLRGFEEVIATNLRTELLNPKWIEGMKGHDYAGAGMMAELVKNTFGWDVTRSQSISDGVWDDIYATYVEDRQELGLRAWFERVNPHALQEIAATMLEASRKGYWRAGDAQLAALSRLYARSVAEHGPSAGLVSGGNRQLDTYVKAHLSAPWDAALARGFEAAMAASTAAPPTPRVRGPKLVEAPESHAESIGEVTPTALGLGAALAIGALLLLLGFVRRSGAAP